MKSCDNPYLVHFGIKKKEEAPVMQTCPVLFHRDRYLERKTWSLSQKWSDLEELHAEAKRYYRKKDVVAYRKAYTETTQFMDTLEGEIEDFLKSPRACDLLSMRVDRYKEDIQMYDEFVDSLMTPDDLEDLAKEKRPEQWY